MKIRTFAGILLALAVVVFVPYLYQLNQELLGASFRLGPERAVPVYLALLAIFLLGFLPAAVVLLTQTLQRDLAERRRRRRTREVRSQRQSLRRALDLEADGQWSRAAAELETYLGDRPEDFAALLHYGQVLRHQGRPEEALEVHRRASVLYPQSVALLLELVEDYEARGESEVALQIRDRILRDFSGYGLGVLRRRRNAALVARDWEEAGRHHERLEALLKENGDDAGLAQEEGVRIGLDYQRGVELLRADRVEEARKVFAGILADEPRFLPARIMTGEADLLRDQPRAALTAWREGFAETGSPVFLQRIEDHFIEREEPLEAIELLHQLIASSENDLLPRFFLGRLYYRLEMHGEALKVLREIAERVEDSPSYHLLLSRIYRRRGNLAKAVEALAACVRLAGLAAAEYSCRVCRAQHPEWQDRCEACGSWNAVDLDFEEEQIAADELGVQPLPVYAIYGESEAFRAGGASTDGGTEL